MGTAFERDAGSEADTMSSRTHAETAAAYAAWLAELFESEAGWRERKAADHPDDHRQQQSAKALRAAAEYVRSIEQPLEHTGIRAFVDFDAELVEWVGGKTPLQLVAESGAGAAGDVGLAAGRFFFYLGGPRPKAKDFDRLISEMFSNMLRSWRESIESGAPQPPASLVEFFGEQKLPLWEGDQDEEAT
jgi:hypothetical protein